MAVKIRLSRVGKKHAPFHRLVAVDSRDRRDGEALEILGTYNPLRKQFDAMHIDKVDAWIQKGAQMTDSAKKLISAYRKDMPSA
jgi:small subunit ribosomal protein S16